MGKDTLVGNDAEISGLIGGATGYPPLTLKGLIEFKYEGKNYGELRDKFVNFAALIKHVKNKYVKDGNKDSKNYMFKVFEIPFPTH